MNGNNVAADALATLVYPGLAAICFLWVHIGFARFMRPRRVNDALLTLTAVFATATFSLLSLSTGLFIILDFLQVRLAIRLGWLVVLMLALWFSIEYLRRQHANYRRR